MKTRFIDKFEVILLDMGRTFMFAGDRFEKTDHLGQTYRKAGGCLLPDEEVYQIASSVFSQMLEDSQEPENYDCFPPVSTYLHQCSESCHLPDSEKELLEKVIAEHEIGVIPETYAAVIQKLSQTHRLGIISDIWSDSRPYYEEFERVGIRSLFEIIVFSSDIGIIKPSAKIFEKAIHYFNVDKFKIVYIGDSMRRDICGAKNAGLPAVWVHDGSSEEEATVPPDLIIRDLKDILT